MTVVVSYTISGDFTNGINLDQLTNEIEDDPGIDTAVLQYINIDNDDVDLVFDIALTGSEDTALDTLISNHVSLIIDQYISVGMNPCITDSTDYVSIYSYIYEGSDIMGVIQNFRFIAKMDSGLTNYNIKLTDITNIQTIFEETYTNLTDRIITITNISNIPKTIAIFELNIKVTGGTGIEKAQIKALEYGILK